MTTRLYIENLGYDYGNLKSTLRENRTIGALFRAIVAVFEFPERKSEFDTICAIHLALSSTYTADALATFKKTQRSESAVWELIKNDLGILTRPRPDLTRLEILALIYQKMTYFAAPKNIVVGVGEAPDNFNWDATFDLVPRAVSYEYIVDNDGSWTPAAGSPIGNSNVAGTHVLWIRGIDADGNRGAIGISDEFELVEV